MLLRWLIAIALGAGGLSFCLAQSTTRELLEEGLRLYERREFDEAGHHFERALAQARQTQDQNNEARARLGLGQVLRRKAQYADARSELEQALAMFQHLSDRLNIGRAYNDLAFLAWTMGDMAQARLLYGNALAEFEAVGDLRRKVAALYNLAFTTPRGEEKRGLIQQGLDLARQLGDRVTEGELLHHWGDTDFAEGDFAAASEKLDAAAKLLEEAGARLELARVLTSLGRNYRVHGRPDRAVESYRRALNVQEQTGDRQGVIQTLNALATAFAAMGENQQAVEHLRRAVALARESGSPGQISFYLANLSAAYVDAQQYARALDLLQEALSLSRDNTNRQSLYLHFGEAYLGLGRYAEAVDALDKAIELAGTIGLRDMLPRALRRRARAKEKLGQPAAALADAREALRALEQLRVQLVPTDFMRRGFANQYQDVFAYAVELLHRSGQHEQALEIAEQARARAFLDLLATRDIDLGGADRLQLSALRELESNLRTKGVDVSSSSLPPLVLRGGDAEAASLWKKWQGADPELRSLVSAPPFSATQVAAAAARLRSTLLAYWVSPDAMFIWVVKPGGPVRAARVDVSAERLRQLIKQASMVAEGDSVRRGADRIYIDESVKDTWRQLYQLLIRPVRPWLPGTSGSRLTVVPHGPLFQVSFAALLDERGRYLVERHDLHYVPAAAVLDFTEKKQRQVAGRPARYLLVADPSGLPASPEGNPLPPLPGSRREVRAIARRAPADSVTLLEGAAAREETLRALASEQTVIHFATHGVVRDDQPFDSFLALSDGERLTAQKIYGLTLAADLVVLSACRTGRGEISGDGIVGLTRAFFYAGAPSVVATLWDVADEPTYLLISNFYEYLHQFGDKSRALRAAQLRLLEALRHGELKVTTPAGTFALPDHPVFWAGFVLQGEP